MEYEKVDGVLETFRNVVRVFFQQCIAKLAAYQFQ